MVAQYGAYSPLPGDTLNGKPAPVIDGYTAEQRLFMCLAQARRGKARNAALVSQLKSDPHSPSEFRVNGSMRNHPGFYEASGVKAGDKMYLKPEERVIFW